MQHTVRVRDDNSNNNDTMINSRRQGEHGSNNNDHNDKRNAYGIEEDPDHHFHNLSKPNLLHDMVTKDKISYEQWKAITMRASTHPMEAHLCDAKGWTVLHHAIKAYRSFRNSLLYPVLEAASSNDTVAVTTTTTTTSTTTSSTWTTSSVMRLFRQFLDAISMILTANPASVYHVCTFISPLFLTNVRTPLFLVCSQCGFKEFALLQEERLHYLSSSSGEREGSYSTMTSYMGDLLKTLLQYNPSTVHIAEERRSRVERKRRRCDRPLRELYHSYYQLWKLLRFGGDDEEGDGSNDGGSVGEMDVIPFPSQWSSTAETYLTLYLSSRCCLHHHSHAEHPSAIVFRRKNDAAAATADNADEGKAVRMFNLTELISNSYNYYTSYYHYYYYTSTRKKGHCHRWLRRQKAADQWEFIRYIVQCNFKSNWGQLQCPPGHVPPLCSSTVGQRRLAIRPSTMDDPPFSNTTATAAAAFTTSPTLMIGLLYSRLAQSFWHQITLLLRAAAAAVTTNSTTSPSSSSLLSMHDDNIYHFPKEYNRGRPVSEQFHPLHVMVELLMAYGCDDVDGIHVAASEKCPRPMNYLAVLFHRACLLYHDELSVRIAKTGGGVTPLLMLLQHSGSSSLSSSFSIPAPPPTAAAKIRERAGIEHCISQCVQWMVYLYPPCASIPDRYTLRYPLHVAVEQTARWICLLDRLQLLGKLVSAAPHLLRRRDNDTKLYPFMLAAVRALPAPSVEIQNYEKKKSIMKETRTRLKLNSLNITYELLRILPDVLTEAALF